MPPANYYNSEKSVYLFNGCVKGKGYSIGWSLPDLILEDNPKSLQELFDLIISQSKNLSSKFTGPIAFNSLDIFASSFVRSVENRVELEKNVADFLALIQKQGLRLSFTLDIIPPSDLSGFIQPSIDIFNEVFSDELEKMYSGYWFEPPVVLNLHNKEIWDHPMFGKYLALSYRFGHPIIQNTLTSTIINEPVRPSGRIVDVEIPYQRLGGPTGNADRTGVLGYVVVNLAKLGYEASSEDNFFTVLNMEIDKASNILEEHRADYRSYMQKDTSPLGFDESDLDWFFSSIVLTGMNEGLQYLIDAPLGHVAGKAVTYKVLEFLRRKLEEIQYETRSLYTLESFPSESLNDGILEMSGLSDHYLTRGTELPHFHGDDLWDAFEHQKKLQSLYTGASMVEIHSKDGLHYHEGCKLLTRRTLNQFGFSYLAVTPSRIAVKEGSDIDIMRIDGVIHRLDTLSDNYKEVHGKRVHYDVKNN